MDGNQLTNIWKMFILGPWFWFLGTAGEKRSELRILPLGMQGNMVQLEKVTGEELIPKSKALEKDFESNRFVPTFLN